MFLFSLTACVGMFFAPVGKSDNDTGAIVDVGPVAEEVVSDTGAAKMDADADTDADTDADADSDADADTDTDTDTDTDSDTDTGTPPSYDNDGDGFVEPLDCDDDFDDVYPSATEACDGRDNDCDGDIDEEGDCDGDIDTAAPADEGDTDDSGGTGDTDTATDTAILDTGAIDSDSDGFTVDEDGDCDDANPAANPAAIEVCDRADNDCDGEVDEGSGACTAEEEEVVVIVDTGEIEVDSDTGADDTGVVADSDSGSADTDTGVAPADSDSAAEADTDTDTDVASDSDSINPDTGDTADVITDTATEDTATAEVVEPETEPAVEAEIDEDGDGYATLCWEIPVEWTGTTFYGELWNWNYVTGAWDVIDAETASFHELCGTVPVTMPFLTVQEEFYNFSDVPQDFGGQWWGAANWGDLDGDGSDDMIVSGSYTLDDVVVEATGVSNGGSGINAFLMW